MRKKLFAILMSAMMMVTFMPAMAFAADTDVTWDYVNKTFTTAAGATYDADVYLDRDASTGDWTGKLYLKTSSKYIEGAAPVKESPAFFDLSLAKVTTINATQIGDATVVLKTNYDAMFNENYATTPVKLTFTAPTTAANYAAAKASGDANAIELSGSQMGSKSVTVATPSYDKTNPYTAQSFTLNTTVSTMVGCINAVPARALTVQAQTAAKTDAVILKDGVATSQHFVTGDAGKVATFNYDGADHTIALSEVPGMTVTYKKLNTNTGIYETCADGVIKVNGVADEGLYQIAAKMATEAVAQTMTIRVDVDAAAVKGSFKFVDVPAKVEAGFNPVDYVQFVATKWNGNALSTSQKAAVEANQALLKEYFNDFYTVEQKVDAKDATKVVVTVKNKKYADWTTAEKDAMVAKYTALYQNLFDEDYSLTRANVTDATGYDRVVLDAEMSKTFTLANEIDWVKAPLTKKYYNKKGTLAKTYTFAVEAVATSKVTYKLTNGGSMIKIDKNTGKVTVMKGLKVGTYTVKVTATAGDASDYYYLTIKMAKKK